MQKTLFRGIEMLKNVEADVLIETTASNYKDAEPGMTHITTAMKKGMHVISVNKGSACISVPVPHGTLPHTIKSNSSLAEQLGEELQF